jgi:hypothetical protein
VDVNHLDHEPMLPMETCAGTRSLAQVGLQGLSHLPTRIYGAGVRCNSGKITISPSTIIQDPGLSTTTLKIRTSARDLYFLFPPQMPTTGTPHMALATV